MFERKRNQVTMIYTKRKPAWKLRRKKTNLKVNKKEVMLFSFGTCLKKNGLCNYCVISKRLPLFMGVCGHVLSGNISYHRMRAEGFEVREFSSVEEQQAAAGFSLFIVCLE